MCGSQVWRGGLVWGGDPGCGGRPGKGSIAAAAALLSAPPSAIRDAHTHVRRSVSEC